MPLAFSPVSRRWAPLLMSALFTAASCALPVTAANAAEGTTAGTASATAKHHARHAQKSHVKKASHGKSGLGKAAKHSKHLKKAHKKTI